MLADVSVDYVVRLEQGRGPRPSQQVLTGLARALRLDLAGRDELFHLAGASPPGPDRIQLHVRPSVLRLIDRFPDLPTIVLSAKGDVLAWNAMSLALHGDWTAMHPERRNLPRLQLLPDPGDPPLATVAMTAEEWSERTAFTIGTLRTAAAKYPDDEGLHRLLAELRAGLTDFEELWAAAPASPRRAATKTIEHPQLGSVQLDCDALHVSDDDQTVVVYSAAPGTPEAEALSMLRVIGTQDLTSPAPTSSI